MTLSTDDSRKIICCSQVRLAKEGENDLKLDSLSADPTNGGKPSDAVFIRSKRDTEGDNLVQLNSSLPTYFLDRSALLSFLLAARVGNLFYVCFIVADCVGNRSNTFFGLYLSLVVAEIV